MSYMKVYTEMIYEKSSGGGNAKTFIGYKISFGPGVTGSLDPETDANYYNVSIIPVGLINNARFLISSFSVRQRRI